MAESSVAVQTLNIPGSVVIAQNALQSTDPSFGYEIFGVPDTLSLAIEGHSADGSVDVLNVYTTVANTTITPNVNAVVYSYFAVVGSWTGGLNAQVKVTTRMTGVGAVAVVNFTRVQSGIGSPEGVLIASVGALYARTDGGAGTTFYVKESGVGATGWVGK